MRAADSSKAQREALKTIIPRIHWEAHERVSSHPEVARELRKLADKMHELSKSGSASVLAAFFGAMG
jgi:hypothetical protein